ncbi:hypothetical protein RJ641_012320 [Dillenia turbinata]|uniref:Uncharacterized protein n=1 Tax=Dillenia turbinata TaxID=194707 RepID=A0AAN8Z5Z0_9MAGN
MIRNYSPAITCYLIVICFLLANFTTASRRLGDGESGQGKSAVRGHPSSTAPQAIGQHAHKPTGGAQSISSVTAATRASQTVDCGRVAKYAACLPDNGSLNRNCKPNERCSITNIP